MAKNRQIYLLDPQKIPPETIAVTFAKTSRSPESFREIAAELNDLKSAEFNEKWVVGYGHSSVAEHAVLHLALENISRLAVETLESNRLASYTEKSTRYQKWDRDAFFVPPELENHLLRKPYIQTCETLFDTYEICLQAVSKQFQSNQEPAENETSAQFERRIRSQAIDVCRFLLPAASLANVGMTINARSLEHAIGKLLTQPLQEPRQIGEEIKKAALTSIPTLLKYADEIPYLREVQRTFAEIKTSAQETRTDWCELCDVDPGALDQVFAAALYHEQQIPYSQATEWMRQASASQKETLIHTLLQTGNRHTIPARELEFAFFTFDLLLDQGAYFEVKRHRMMTQIPQALTARLGYATPRAIEAAGVLDRYQAAMETARLMYSSLAEINPALAAYVVPNGFNRRVLLKLNLRSLVHFIRLRSAPNAHFSVRRAAQKMYEEVSNQIPLLHDIPGRNEEESSLSIERDYFFSTCQ
ncbi:MAG: FAD-dependent thymidylate synthase [Anaerolineaceae bacterium]|nr:FAD-dependent thymidylate synthase [Anaerolineaceae bacterium]